MVKKKRVQARIERDKARKQRKREINNGNHDDIKSVMTIGHSVNAVMKCNKSVMYKSSTQAYNHSAITSINEMVRQTENGDIPLPSKIDKVTIHERGKQRIITPIKYHDRVPQRVLCDNALVPVLTRSLIYDNGASTKGKGVDFARKRLLQHLQSAVNEYGTDFYALVFDFKSFFDSIPHKTCRNVLSKAFNDELIVKVTMDIIHSYQIVETLQSTIDMDERNRIIESIRQDKSHGICLGSQISQIMALAVPNRLDHFIKDRRSFKHYVRYMDDGVVLHKNKDKLKELLQQIKVVASELGLTFNEKKTRIVKMSKGFTFMKVKYFVTNNGKVIRTLVRTGVVRMRRKLKKFKRLLDEGKMNLDDIYASIQSWLGHSKIAKSYHTRKRMLRLYDELFGGYKLTKKYKRQLSVA